MNKEGTYIPKVIKDQGQTAYAEFLLEVERCPTCGKWMLAGDVNRLAAAFPKWGVLKLQKQLDAAGMAMMSAAKSKDNIYICVVVRCEGSVFVRLPSMQARAAH